MNDPIEKNPDSEVVITVCCKKWYEPKNTSEEYELNKCLKEKTNG